MPSIALPRRTATDVTRVQQETPDAPWAGCELVDPSRFNTWPIVRELAMALPRRLEVAPGLRPRLPLDGTFFVDVSRTALAGLRAWGASAACGTVSELPCPDASFDLVCALDILGHLPDDQKALRELSRVAAPDARLLLSVALQETGGNSVDATVNQDRRYVPDQFAARLNALGWTIERSAVYDPLPPSRRLAALGRWCLQRGSARALWWHNRVLTPLGLRLQRPLRWQPGLVSAENAGSLLLLCRRA